jgi:soluble lytic murein transglycosylase-like protein
MSEPVERVREYMPLIQRAAARHGLPAQVLAGLVCQESGGIPWAIRFEPRYRWLVWEIIRRPAAAWRLMSRDTREWSQRVSWGPCQIMGAVAVERGFRGWPPELCQWDVGLHYGAKHLAWCLRRRGGDMHRALLRYNGGGDPDYPRRVMRWASRIQDEL